MPFKIKYVSGNTFSCSSVRCTYCNYDVTTFNLRSRVWRLQTTVNSEHPASTFQNSWSNCWNTRLKEVPGNELLLTEILLFTTQVFIRQVIINDKSKSKVSHLWKQSWKVNSKSICVSGHQIKENSHLIKFYILCRNTEFNLVKKEMEAAKPPWSHTFSWIK